MYFYFKNIKVKDSSIKHNKDYLRMFLNVYNGHNLLKYVCEPNGVLTLEYKSF